MFFYRVISDISVIQRETTLTISDSLRQSQQSKPNCESGSLSTTEITDITRFEKKKRSSGSGYLKSYISLFRWLLDKWDILLITNWIVSCLL